MRRSATSVRRQFRNGRLVERRYRLIGLGVLKPDGGQPGAHLAFFQSLKLVGHQSLKHVAGTAQQVDFDHPFGKLADDFIGLRPFGRQILELVVQAKRFDRRQSGGAVLGVKVHEALGHAAQSSGRRAGCRGTVRPPAGSC